MERATLPLTDGKASLSRFPHSLVSSQRTRFSSTSKSRAPRLLWTVLLLGLLIWHANMTLLMFGPDEPWRRLTDEQPIVSGRHAVHLYHGYLGAFSFRASHRLSCFDPAFDIGYPETPIFDSGSRPGQLFLGLAGGEYDPAAYKVGLAITCLLVPVFVIIASGGAGFGLNTTFFATAASLLVWWSTPCRRALEAGDIDLLIAALAILAHVGLLIRFDGQPGFLTWQGMLFTACVGWFAHPMLFLMVLPLMLVYYMSTGVRHELTTWHLTLALSELGALAVNVFWLNDWLRHWWLRSPLPSSDGMLLHRTFATLWAAPQWGEYADRILVAVLLVSALVGIAVLNQYRERVAARLFGLGAGGLWLLAILGISWEPLGQIGTAQLMVPALWFAALPAAYAWTQTFRLIAWLTGSTFRGLVVACGLLAALGFVQRDLLAAWSLRCTEVPHFALGLGPERETLVEALRQATTAEARILWEDHQSTDDTKRWTALLPLLTGRSFIGGLDPNRTIPHSSVGLIDQSLAGKPLVLWSDAELASYCKRYNVGWIVSRTPESLTRFRAWPGARETAQWSDGEPVYLFTVVNAPRSFVLKGKATIRHMDAHHITLADVEPENGVVVLSLHYQSGLQATPERIAVETDEDRGDLIPFVRLRVDRPVAIVTLTWTGR
jgi:hypothetical protein